MQTKSFFQFLSKSDIIKIIVFITLLFVLLQFTRISMLLSKSSDDPFYTYLYNKLALPSNVKTFVTQPWSLFTYFFLDGSFMHIIGNMIWLYIFGSVIEDLKGPNRILPIFITGAVFGGICMLVFSVLKIQPVQFYEGATSAVMAVAFSALLFKPSYKFWMFFGIGIPIWVFVLIFIAIQLATIQLANIPYLFLLLGGIVIGLLSNHWLYGYMERFSNLLKRSSTWFSNEQFVLPKQHTIRSNTSRHLPFKTIQFTPKKIDEILDKINESGMSALSKEEKRLLEEYSKSRKE
jgi:membrane associated rhomboid family serine protease